MKKLVKNLRNYLLILILILNIIPNISLNNVHAKSSEQTELNYGYYKSMSACLLFKSSDITDMSLENIYFIVPEGYFVKKIQDVTATTIKVSYDNFVGYVMTERVKAVSFLPNTKYLKNITFNISKSSGTQLWSIPSSDDSSNILFRHIESGTKNISYIASVSGEIPVGATSPIWYYCEYSPESDPTSVYVGYIHSEKTIGLSPIPENIEDDIIIKDNTEINNSPFNLSNTMQIILITLVSLPLLTIIVILLLSTKRKEKQKLQEELLKPTENIDEEIYRKRSQKIHDMEGKKFTLKERFNNFMFESEKPVKSTNSRFTFENLDSIEDDDLL